MVVIDEGEAEFIGRRVWKVKGEWSKVILYGESKKRKGSVVGSLLRKKRNNPFS